MLASTIERHLQKRLRPQLLRSRLLSSPWPASITIPTDRSFSASSTSNETTTATPGNVVSNKLRERTQHYLRQSKVSTQDLRDRVDVRTAALRQRVHDGVNDAKDTARDIRANPGTMLKTYGPVFVGTYISIYLATLGSLTAGIQSGVLDPVVLMGQIGYGTGGETETVQQLVVSLLQQSEWTASGAEYVEQYPYLANFGVAWIAAKFTEPVRIPIAVGLTPRVARSIGWSTKKKETEGKETTPPSD